MGGGGWGVGGGGCTLTRRRIDNTLWNETFSVLFITRLMEHQLLLPNALLYPKN